MSNKTDAIKEACNHVIAELWNDNSMSFDNGVYKLGVFRDNKQKGYRARYLFLLDDKPRYHWSRQYYTSTKIC